MGSACAIAEPARSVATRRTNVPCSADLIATAVLAKPVYGPRTTRNDRRWQRSSWRSGSAVPGVGALAPQPARLRDFRGSVDSKGSRAIWTSTRGKPARGGHRWPCRTRTGAGLRAIPAPSCGAAGGSHPTSIAACNSCASTACRSRETRQPVDPDLAGRPPRRRTAVVGRAFYRSLVAGRSGVARPRKVAK